MASVVSSKTKKRDRRPGSAAILSSKSKEIDKRLGDSEKTIVESLKRFQITAESESESRKQGLDDLKFSIGTGQWDESVKANREIDGKPCLTVNRAPSILRQFTGDERQHRPAMLVNPVGSGADVEVGKIHQGVLRHIEVASFADVTYDDSYDWMLRTGWCPWRVKTDYVSDMSFDQEPRIEPFENPFNAYLSPIRNPLGQDPLWAHVIEDLSREEYKLKYPNSLMMQLRFPTDTASPAPGWVTKAGARVAEYWWLELKSAVICQLADGSVKFKKDLTSLEKAVVDDERETVVRTVRCIKHNSIEILENYEYLGRYIPLVDLFGTRLNVNGRSYKAGIIRDYRDAQRIYDFMSTRAVEQIDAQGKDPLFVAQGANTPFEEIYRMMNRKNYPWVPFLAYDEQGRQLPPPMRANRNVDTQGITTILQRADYDMKAVVGIYGPQVDSPDMKAESGFAILTRQTQSDKGMVSYSDNLNRAIRWQGKILLDLWPRYITEPKLMRIVNPDDSIQHAAVFNSQYGGTADDADYLLSPNNLKKAYDVGRGEYDVTLSAGPMSQTGRQEGFKALTQVIAQPAIAQSPVFLPILALWAQNADFNGADTLAKTLKKTLPPIFQDSEATDKDTQLAQKDAALQQLSAEHQQLVAELARASDTIRTKRLDLESRERVALTQQYTQLVLQMLKDHGVAANAHLQAQLDAITNRLTLLHESIPMEAEAGPAPQTPELPGKVEPKVQPITPASPVTPVPGSTG